MSDLIAGAWHKYLRQLDRKPVKTKAVTAAALAALSDLIAQRIRSNAPLNWRRTLAMALFGFVWSGPSNHYWQQFLETLFKGKRDPASVCEKVLLEQVTYGPLCNLLMMTYISTVVDGRSWRYTQQNISLNYLQMQRNGWKLWPIAALINYYYVPVKLRVLFVNLVALGWSTFLISQSRAGAVNVRKVPAVMTVR